MTKSTIEKAMNEAAEFLALAGGVLDQNSDTKWIAYGMETGALRRKSMDLTRALAALRKPTGSAA